MIEHLLGGRKLTAEEQSDANTQAAEREFTYAECVNAAWFLYKHTQDDRAWQNLNCTPHDKQAASEALRKGERLLGIESLE